MTDRIDGLQQEHLDGLRRFLAAIPDGDVTFIKEDVRDPDVAEAWATGRGSAQRWVSVTGDGAVSGLVMLEPLVGWSAHVGSLRVVTDPERRHQGLGRGLSMHALRAAVEMGLEKVVVEVVAEQEGAVRMFADLGFRPEAVLADHVRDREGTLRDLLVLAHVVDDEWATMTSVGIADEVG